LGPNICLGPSSQTLFCLLPIGIVNTWQKCLIHQVFTFSKRITLLVSIKLKITNVACYAEC
jgi:hypothetical protein